MVNYEKMLEKAHCQSSGGGGTATVAEPQRGGFLQRVGNTVRRIFRR